jgi:hypothetical protein
MNSSKTICGRKEVTNWMDFAAMQRLCLKLGTEHLKTIT